MSGSPLFPSTFNSSRSGGARPFSLRRWWSMASSSLSYENVAGCYGRQPRSDRFMTRRTERNREKWLLTRHSGRKERRPVFLSDPESGSRWARYPAALLYSFITFFACLLAFDAIWSLHHFAEIHQLARFSAVILPGKTTVEGNSQEGLVYNTGGNNYNSTRFSHFRVAPIARAGAYPRKESRMTWFKSRKDWQREREGGKKGKDFCPIRTNARHCLSAISLFSSSSFDFVTDGHLFFARPH